MQRVVIFLNSYLDAEKLSVRVDNAGLAIQLNGQTFNQNML